MRGGAFLKAAALPLLGFAMLLATLLWGAWLGSFPAWLLGMGAAATGLVLVGAFVQQAGSLRDSVLSLTYSLFVFLSLLFAYMIAANNSRSIDITQHGIHTLSPELATLLGDLPYDVEAVVFAEARAHASIHQFLSLAARESPRLRFQLVDPVLEPGAAAQMADNISRGEMILTAREGTEVRRRLRTAFNPFSPLRENAFYNALVRTVWESNQRIYFTTGHGERGLRPRGEGAGESLSLLVDALQRNVMPVDQIDLRNLPSVPADVAVVVIAQPRWDLFDSERDMLREFLAEGGALLVMADPILRPTAAGQMESLSNLKDLLEEFGVRLLDEVLIDPRARSESPGTVLADVWYEHPINAGGGMPGLVGRMMRPMEPFSTTGDSNDGITREGLWASNPDSWSVPVLEFLRAGGRPTPPADRSAAGSRFVAMATSKPTPGGLRSDAARLVVIGDSDWASDGLIGATGASTFAAQTMNWLVRPRFAFSIPPREIPPSSLNLTLTQYWLMLGGLLLGGLLLLVGGAGATIWRRKRG